MSDFITFFFWSMVLTFLASVAIPPIVPFAICALFFASLMLGGEWVEFGWTFGMLLGTGLVFLFRSPNYAMNLGFWIGFFAARDASRK